MASCGPLLAGLSGLGEISVVANLLRLPQVPPVVSDEQIEARSQRHPQKRDSRELGLDLSQMEPVGFLRQSSNAGGNAAILGQCLFQVRIRQRQVLFGRPILAFHRRLHRRHEFCGEQAVLKRAFAFDPSGETGVDCGLQLRQIGAIDQVEVAYALGDGPASGLGAPIELLARETVCEGIRVAKIRVDFRNYNRQIVR